MTMYMQTAKIYNGQEQTFSFATPVVTWAVGVNGFQLSYGSGNQHDVGQASCSLAVTPSSGTATQVTVVPSLTLARSGGDYQDDGSTFVIVTIIASDTTTDFYGQNVQAAQSGAETSQSLQTVTGALAGFSVGDAGQDAVAVTSFSADCSVTVGPNGTASLTGGSQLPGVPPGTVDVAVVGSVNAPPQNFFIDTVTLDPGGQSNYGTDLLSYTYTAPASILGEQTVQNITFLLQSFNIAFPSGDSSEVLLVRVGCLQTSTDVEFPTGTTPSNAPADAWYIVDPQPTGGSFYYDMSMWRPADGFVGADLATTGTMTFLVVGVTEPAG
jgi:hypothetical protein